MNNDARPVGTLEGTAYARSREWLVDALAVDPDVGLRPAEVADRRAAFGTNTIGTVRRTSYWRLLLSQVRGAVVWLLIAAAALSLWIGDMAEAIAIVVVLIVNTLIGFVTEARSALSMDALRKLTHTTARVRRPGGTVRIDAAELVPGDIVLLEAGDVVPADLRVIEAVDLNADESALTGESVPVAKSTDAMTGRCRWPTAKTWSFVVRRSPVARRSASPRPRGADAAGRDFGAGRGRRRRSHAS